MGYKTSIDDVVMESELSVISTLCEYYCKQCDFMLRAHHPESIPEFIQEGEKWNAFKADIKAAKGSDEESVIKRILLFIPRILKAIAKAIGRLFQKQKTDTMISELEDLQDRVQALESNQEKINDNIRICAKHIIHLHAKLNNGLNLNDEQHAAVVQYIKTLYDDLRKLNMIKVDKSDNISQIRAVLTLSGYVLFSFDLAAYKNFLEDFEESLSKMDKLNEKDDDINFSQFSIVNIGHEIDSGKYEGHYIYRISNFEKYMTDLKKASDRVSNHCQKLTAKFEGIAKRWKYKKNTDEKSVVIKNANEALKVLRHINATISRTYKMYTTDENNIRRTIKEEMNAITTLDLHQPDQSESNNNTKTEDAKNWDPTDIKSYKRSDTTFVYQKGSGLPKDVEDKLLSLATKLANFKRKDDFNEYMNVRNELLDLTNMQIAKDRVFSGIYNQRLKDGYVLIDCKDKEKRTLLKPGTKLYHTSPVGGITDLEPTFVSGTMSEVETDHGSSKKYYSTEAFYPSNRIYFHIGKAGSRVIGGASDTIRDDEYCYEYILKPGDVVKHDEELGESACFIETNHPLQVTDVTDQKRKSK